MQHLLRHVAGTRPEPPPPKGALVVTGTLLICLGALIVPYWAGSFILFRYAYLVLTLGLGIVLYRYFPVTFLGYACWLWFLTPFVRRVIDYQVGWEDPNIVMLAPFLVSGLGGLTLLRHRKQLLDKDFFPFALVIAAVLYGYLIGLFNQGILVASYSLLNWLVPVLLGLHLILNWPYYPDFRRCIRRTFLWGLAVMGGYALVQFYLLPPWDAYWMANAGMGSIGTPRPMEVRSFSTMNAPEPFAMVMMAGLLMLFSAGAWSHVLVAAPGYLGFLMSLVRSTWGGWAVGVVTIALSAGGRMRTRLLVVLAAVALLAVPLTQVEALSARIGKRFASFGDLSEDTSFQARSRLYETMFLLAITNPLGSGIGWAGTGAKITTGETNTIDSGLIVIGYQLGWPGMLLYLSGILLLVLNIWRGHRWSGDFFAAVCLGIAVATVALLLFRNAFAGSSGAIFWCFIGLGVASARYGLLQAWEAAVREAEAEGMAEAT
jgi:hypothetical protein